MAATETSAGFLTCRVSQDLIDWFARRAQEKGVARSDEVRAALEAYREQQA